MNRLWTKDFTIITVGSVISMFGNAVSGFALGLLVLDYTGSTLLYALYMVVYSLPRVIVPLLAGPYVDRYSRKKMIYSLDFISAALYGGVALLLNYGSVSYAALLGISVLVGSIDSVYSVAYDSLYPTLIAPGNYTKAYSVSSLIYPLATTIMVPVAGICYNTVGLMPLFLFNACTFLIAAVFETQIRANEEHLINRRSESFSLRRYAGDFREGLNYLKQEKGLSVITAYFFVNTMVGGVMGALTLPFFRSHTFEMPAAFSWMLKFVSTGEGLGVAVYTIVMSVATLGRLIGGLVHYRFRYPVDKKFLIAVFVYTTLSFLDGGYMFLPVAGMLIANLLIGMLGVTSFNIRISATQNYVDDKKRGRFNGIFTMITMFGSIMGQLAGGGLSTAFEPRMIIAVSAGINLIAVFAIMWRGGRYVKPIYNREA